MTTAPAIAEHPKGEAWHSRSAEEVLAHLGSSATGLSAQEAAQRLAADGPNELKEGKRISPLQIFLGQFKSLIIWILIAAGVISGVLGEVVDAIAILAIVVLNAVIGFYQEFNAEKSIAALKKMTAPQAKVRRDGQVTSIPASGIVAGDILALEAGDLVAADARLLEAASLKCIESALTGESEAVTKQPATLEQGDVPLGDRENMVFMGTSVAAGTGQAVVVATAMNTELGRIAGLIEEAGAEEKTPLQKKLDSFGRILVWAALGIVALLFGLGLLRGTKPFELFMTSVSLAVAAVPEGLAGRRHGCARARRVAHVPPPRAGAQTAGGRDARLDDGHLHGQDRHLDGRRNDRARALCRGPKLRSHRRRLRAGRRSALRGQEAGSAARGAVARTGDRPPRLQQCASRPGRRDLENRRRSHRRRIACGRSPKPAATGSASSRNCRSSTKSLSTPTANGAR